MTDEQPPPAGAPGITLSREILESPPCPVCGERTMRYVNDSLTGPHWECGTHLDQPGGRLPYVN